MVWGESFNYSIWYLALKGVNDPAVVDKAVREHTRLQEQEVRILGYSTRSEAEKLFLTPPFDLPLTRPCGYVSSTCGTPITPMSIEP